MPCFNHGRFLKDSVQGVLGQTHDDLELIIIDDRSSDSSWETINNLARADSRIRAIRHEQNEGVSKSRNDGLRAAQGEFIAFCDADDIWDQEKLKVQLSLLRNKPDYDVAYCDSRIIDENGVPTGKRFGDLFPPPNASSGCLFRELIRGNFINTQSVLMRRACVQQIGYFDEDLKVVEDWWYWIRLSHDHRILYSKQSLASYRVHSGSTSVVHKRIYGVSRYKVLRRLLKRYPDLPRREKAQVIFGMGADLCDLGKSGVGRRLLWKAVRLSTLDAKAWSTCSRAFRRIVLHAAGGPKRGRQ